MKHRARQWQDWHDSRYYKEVYWLDWKESECGQAWEQTMFGGTIVPINNRVDGSHGICISDWPPHGTENDPERRVWNTISMRYIEKLFQMSTWQRSFRLQDWRIFHVPRDGATSLYVNSFTTMSESEEHRVAREELAEAVALANAQPAKKKRVKALGRMEEQRPKDEKVIEEAVTEQDQQPESPKPQTPPLDGKRRASSPGALPGQRLILAPHTRRLPLGLLPLPEKEPSQPIVVTSQSAIPAPPASDPPKKTIDSSANIYPKHGESSSSSSSSSVAVAEEVPKAPTTSEIIKAIKRHHPTGLVDAFRQRRRIGLAKKEADKKRKRDAAEERNDELRRSLIREAEGLREELAEAKREIVAMREREGADAETTRLALANKVLVEARERGKRKNRLL